MTDIEAQRILVSVVADWLVSGNEAGEFVERYWRTRRELLQTNPAAFDGQVAELLSHADIALHSYFPEPQGPDEIGEPELRRELTTLIEQLRGMGFPLNG